MIARMDAFLYPLMRREKYVVNDNNVDKSGLNFYSLNNIQVSCSCIKILYLNIQQYNNKSGNYVQYLYGNTNFYKLLWKRKIYIMYDLYIYTEYIDLYIYIHTYLMIKITCFYSAPNQFQIKRILYIKNIQVRP